MRDGWLAIFIVAAMAEEDSFTIKRYYGGPLGPEQFYFKACLIHMPLQKEHVADGGLEFRINMETGKNTARAPVQFDVEPGSARHAEIMERQLRVIDDADERVNQGDGESVRRRIAAAAAWGDVELLGTLLRTCYVSQSTADAVLFEVASTGGGADVVELLLRAGASGAAPLAKGRTALHAAMNSGHEECAAAIVAASPSRAATAKQDDAGQSAVDLARANDFGGVARRIGAAIDALG